MKMEEILFDMIEKAEKNEGYDLIKYAKEIVDKFGVLLMHCLTGDIFMKSF